MNPKEPAACNLTHKTGRDHCSGAFPAGNSAVDLHGDHQVTGTRFLAGDSDALAIALARRTSSATGFSLKARVPMCVARVGQRP